MKQLGASAGALVLIAFGACATLAPKADALNDERGIRALIAEYEASWATHDSARRWKLFAPDAEITNVVGETRYGITGLRELQSSPRYQLMYTDAVEKIDSVRIRMLVPSLAFVTAHSTMTGARHADGTAWPMRHGYLSLVVRQVNGSWLIEEFANAEIPPRP